MLCVILVSMPPLVGRTPEYLIVVGCIEMLYSRLPALCRQVVLLLSIAQLHGCGSNGQSNGSSTTPSNQIGDLPQNADVSTPVPDASVLNLNVSRGGYVINGNVTLLCSEQFSYCETEANVGSIETLHAVSRFGHSFTGWMPSATSREALDLIVAGSTEVDAFFQPSMASDAMAANHENWSCQNDSNLTFRALHLGDSLTLGPALGTDARAYMPEPASIAFYEQQAGSHVSRPLVVSQYGFLVVGFGNGDPEQTLQENHHWRQSLKQQGSSIDDFDAVVVALGSNDILQILAGLDADFVIEQRVKPLLHWIGQKPVYWILPHYARWPAAMQNIRFNGTSEGLNCSCTGGIGHTATQCNIVDEMQSCAVDQALQQKTIEAFRAIHALRARLAELQNDHANLIVVDPAATIAAASNDQHDLYATMLLPADTIHFSLQGSEWFAWLHAWLAMHGNANCALPELPKWQMGTAEAAMAAQLHAAP